LNGVNPKAYPTDTLAKIDAGHPISRIAATAFKIACADFARGCGWIAASR